MKCSAKRRGLPILLALRGPSRNTRITHRPATGESIPPASASASLLSPCCRYRTRPGRYHPSSSVDNAGCSGLNLHLRCRCSSPRSSVGGGGARCSGLNLRRRRRRRVSSIPLLMLPLSFSLLSCTGGEEDALGFMASSLGPSGG